MDFRSPYKWRSSPSQHDSELGGSPVFIDSTDSPRRVRNGNTHSNFSSPFSIIESPSSAVVVSSESTSGGTPPSRALHGPTSLCYVEPTVIDNDYLLIESDSNDLEGLLSPIPGTTPTIALTVASSELAIERNAEFHKIFHNVPLGDPLFNDYECVYGLYGLNHGRLYISANHICFHNDAPWVVIPNIVIPFNDVVSLKRMATATNGVLRRDCIQINTRISKWTFSFLFLRDAYETMYNTWRQWASKPIACLCGKEGKHFETLIIDTVIPGAPKTVYDLMFTGGFLKEFMTNCKDQSLAGIQISDWYPEQFGSRSITYTQLCNGEQIKWEFKDDTLHMDLNDYVSILTTARISDVLGEVLITKIRTCIMQAGAAISRLVITTTVGQAERKLSTMETLFLNDQRGYYIKLESAICSHIAMHGTKSPSNSRIADPEMRQGCEVSTPQPLIGKTIAQSALVPSGVAINPVGSNKCPVATNEGAPSFVSVGSTNQHPNEAGGILQSESPQYMASVMYGYLIQHGFLDLGPLMNPSGFSSSAVAEGGFGDIWSGRLHNDGKKVAIKVLRFASLTGDSTKKELKRIAREIYNWSKLDHGNVNKLMGVIMFRERLGMVSEWMEHGNLRQYLNQNKGVDRHKLCIQVARGVAYLHGVNMVHGDLKGCNILVSSTGVLKITDFDYSIFPECSLAFSATSRMGGGTLRWMAHELLLYEEPPQRNLKTDIYALGMTLLETITNAHPYFECRHDNQIYRKLSRGERPKRSEEYFPDTEWGNQIWGLLLQCWDFNPTARPTADYILKSLLTLKI